MNNLNNTYGIFNTEENYKAFNKSLASVCIQLQDAFDLYGDIEHSVSPGGTEDYLLIDSAETVLTVVKNKLVNELFGQIKFLTYLNTSSTGAFVGEALASISRLRSGNNTYENTAELVMMAIGSTTHFIIDCIEYFYTIKFTDTYLTSQEGMDNKEIYDEIMSDEIKDFAKPFDTTYNEYFNIADENDEKYIVGGNEDDFGDEDSDNDDDSDKKNSFRMNAINFDDLNLMN